jgi:hypothetical protein
MPEPQPPADPSRAVERLRQTFTPLLAQLTPEVEPMTAYNPAANRSLLPPAGNEQS